MLTTLSVVGLCFCVFAIGVKAGYWLAQSHLKTRGYLDTSSPWNL